jgi:hypothetical protein
MEAVLRQQAVQLATEMAGQVQTAEDLSVVLQLMSKTLIERVLDAEMSVHLEEERAEGGEDEIAVELPSFADEAQSSSEKRKRRNRRNGRSSKTISG